MIGIFFFLRRSLDLFTNISGLLIYVRDTLKNETTGTRVSIALNPDFLDVL